MVGVRKTKVLMIPIIQQYFKNGVKRESFYWNTMKDRNNSPGALR